MAAMHMNPAEAVQAHRELNAQQSLGMHFGTWQLTDEGIDDPSRDLASALAAENLDSKTFQPGSFGRTITLPA
jgi:N-acyl-phosphatidylethanolamine-hydrolysing phospholipase D